jgi:hypothetical protein
MIIEPTSALASVYPGVPLKVTVCPACSAVPAAGTMLMTLVTESFACVGEDGAVDGPPHAPRQTHAIEIAASLFLTRIGTSYLIETDVWKRRKSE